MTPLQMNNKPKEIALLMFFLGSILFPLQMNKEIPLLMGFFGSILFPLQMNKEIPLLFRLFWVHVIPK